MRIVSDFENGTPSNDPLFKPVVTLLAGNGDFERPCGTAVIVGPGIAITAAHCLMDWQPSLFLRPLFLPEYRYKVQAIVWPAHGQTFTWHQPVADFPRALELKWRDDIVILKFEMPDVSQDVAQIAEAPASLGYDVNVVAENPRRRFPESSNYPACYAGLRVMQVEDGLLHAFECNRGFPRASGAPVYTKQGDTSYVVGIQSMVAKRVLPPGDAQKRYSGVIPLTRKRLGWIARWQNEDVPEHPINFKIDMGQRFQIVRKSDAVILSGEQFLQSIPDLDFFHAKSWSLIASGTLGLLTSHGTVHTTRWGADGPVRLQIISYARRNIAELLLVPGGERHLNLWLHGWICFEGKLVHVYLYRGIDSGGGSDYKGRIRIEAFEQGGAYDDHKPDEHAIVFAEPAETFDGLTGVVDALQRASWPTDPNRWVRYSGPAGFVQDEVANGHEGHHPP